MDTQCELGSGNEVVTTDLHDAFKLWCEEEDAEVMSAQKVRKELESLAIGYRKDRRHRYYVGLRLSDDMQRVLLRWRKGGESEKNAPPGVAKPATGRTGSGKTRVKLA